MNAKQSFLELGTTPLAFDAPLSPDLAKYRALLNSIELTDEQADAILLEIWGFMLRCVEAQFALPSIHDIFAELLSDVESPVANECMIDECGDR